MDPSVASAMSVDISLAQTNQAASILILKKGMEMQQSTGAALCESLGSLSPNVGSQLDIRA